MNTMTMQTLKRLEATNGKPLQAEKQPRLKVYYGWSKINKIQKREAIAVAFENEELTGDENRRSGKSLRKTMTICYERYQTKEEMGDAPYHNRVFTVYNVFLDDKHIGGSLNVALADNAAKDRKHVSQQELNKITEALKYAFLVSHPDYQEPVRQLEILFDK